MQAPGTATTSSAPDTPPDRTGSAGRDRPNAPAERRVRFADLLAPRASPADPADRPAAAPAVPGFPDLVGSPILRTPPAAHQPTPAPATPAVALPPLPLRDVSLARGDGATAVRLTLEEGGLAGLRMQVVLRGESLDLALAAPDPALRTRVAALEPALREALAERGFDLSRFDTGRDAAREDDDPDEPADRPRRTRTRRGHRGSEAP